MNAAYSSYSSYSSSPAKRRPLVLVSCNGVNTPWAMIHLDATPEFD